MNDREAAEFTHRHRLKQAAMVALQKREEERQARELRDFEFVDFSEVVEHDELAIYAKPEVAR